MKIIAFVFLLFTFPTICLGQIDLQKPFQDCQLKGSITLYDYKNKKWTYSDEADSRKETLPASTFKIIHSLIALETGVVKDEFEVIKWVGQTDTVLYGYRPDIYKDMNMKEAFELSAGWVYIEFAKRIDRKQYVKYLQQCGYGNHNLTEPDFDFWNFGSFGISPVNQINFLRDLYEEKLPFSNRNQQIVKRIMQAEQTNSYTIYAKTGWTRFNGMDVGWWVGYVERKDNVYFFSTRVSKLRSTPHPNFGPCRKEITKAVLNQMGILDK
ncbi:class D beta-lactamase [Rhodocytophaga rosea]|uniref:beta-lactamase n=1 Tax=Rhodocytophaga rosea TaxID=2704465 RepID=A0A6C0GSA2_9BACT|nr:class D beta-lactamase [Rhodocytophaga rosea]QHT70949.1 class D beta-lactamase [Rhodocytophaga rosea]